MLVRKSASAIVADVLDQRARAALVALGLDVPAADLVPAIAGIAHIEHIDEREARIERREGRVERMLARGRKRLSPERVEVSGRRCAAAIVRQIRGVEIEK